MNAFEEALRPPEARTLAEVLSRHRAVIDRKRSSEARLRCGRRPLVVRLLDEERGTWDGIIGVGEGNNYRSSALHLINQVQLDAVAVQRNDRRGVKIHDSPAAR